MKKFLFSFSLILVSIFSVVISSGENVFASEIKVTFDYNTSRIEKYLPKEYNLTANLTTTSYTLTNNIANPPHNINSSILSYYDYVWTVEGEEIDIDSYVVTEDTTFVVNWRPKEYSIHYNYLTIDELSQITNILHEEKYSIEHPVKFYIPNRPYYYFLGWYTSTKFREQDSCNFTDKGIGDRNIYARWKPIDYMITYHSDVINEDNPITYNVESVDLVLEAPVKEGHIFKGWYLDKYLTHPYNIINHGSNGDLDLYPMWELEEYNVTFILPNGEKQTVKADYGTKATVPNARHNIFEIVVYDNDVSKISSDMVINVRYVNIWYVYLIALIILITIPLSIVLVKRHKQKQLHKLRYIYQSNFKRK